MTRLREFHPLISRKCRHISPFRKSCYFISALGRMGIFSNTLQKYLKAERVLTHGPPQKYPSHPTSEKLVNRGCRSYGTAPRVRQIVKYGLDWICKTCSGFVKAGLVKGRFLKHGFVKGRFVKHGFVKGGSVKQGFEKG